MGFKTYTGLTPSNVNKDAKYSVTASGDIKLVFRLDTRTKELLTTSDHPQLAGMVNDVKNHVNKAPGGVFYINEFGDVLVPDGDGGSYWAGHYERTLEFAFEGDVLSAVAPPHIKPGDPWDGPHPGVRYVLRAGGKDIKYELKQGTRLTAVHLSDEVGASAAAETAARVASVKGTAGGRFYINECRELFCPGPQDDFAHFVYIGHLEDSAWFDAPDGYERP